MMLCALSCLMHPAHFAEENDVGTMQLWDLLRGICKPIEATDALCPIQDSRDTDRKQLRSRKEKNTNHHCFLASEDSMHEHSFSSQGLSYILQTPLPKSPWNLSRGWPTSRAEHLGRPLPPACKVFVQVSNIAFALLKMVLFIRMDFQFSRAEKLTCDSVENRFCFL